MLIQFKCERNEMFMSLLKYLCAAGSPAVEEDIPKDIDKAGNDGGGGSSSSALAKSIGGALSVVLLSVLCYSTRGGKYPNCEL